MTLKFQEIEIRPKSRELFSSGNIVSVQPKAFDLLLYLIEHRDRAVDKEELLEQIWPDVYVSETSLTRCIMKARKAINDEDADHPLIKTVHGHGYRFLGELIEEARIVALNHDRPSIAILPFDNMSIDPEQEYLADGICEDIITLLSKMPGMDVVARNSTFKYKNRPIDLSEIGKEQAASHILEGSIRCIENRVRITAQLIDCANGNHVWADRYDRELSDLFALQDEITRAVVSALHIELVAGERAQYWARGTESFEAWKLQLRATQLISTQKKEACKKGRALAQEAAKLDPNYSEPWATLGISYAIEFMDGWEDPPDLVIANALSVLNNALERNPDNPLALVTLGLFKTGMCDYDNGYAMARHGYELGSDSFDIVGMYIFSAVVCGKCEEAKQAVIDLTNHFPDLDAWHVNMLGFYYFAAGDLQESMKATLAAVERNSSYLIAHVQLAFTYAALGQIGEAQEAVRTLLRLNANYSSERIRMTLVFKDQEVLEKIIDDLQAAGLPEAVSV